MTRIISLVAGKTGVGKTSIGINVAARLSRRGQRVCLIDAGSGATPASRLLGLDASRGLRDLALSGAGPEQVLQRHRDGFDVIPGGVDGWLGDLAADGQRALAHALGRLDGYDFVIIDTPAGGERDPLALTLAAGELLLVITPYAGALDAAYARLKLLYAEQYAGTIRVVVNSVRDHATGQACYDRFARVSAFYLELGLSLLGLVRTDPSLGQAGDNRRVLVSESPESSAATDLRCLADELLRQPGSGDDMRHFAERYLQAAGVPAPKRQELALVSPHENDDGEDLHMQLEYLSVQVEELIGEVARLREDEAPTAAAEAVPEGEAEPGTPALAGKDWIESLASASERVPAEGGYFTLCRRDRRHGGPVYFACHGVDDAAATAESSGAGGD